MRELAGGVAMRGLVVLGVDTLSPGDKVRHWGKKIDDYFKKEMKEQDLSRLPREIYRCPHDDPQPVDWVAAKNKYFVQILHPKNGGEYAQVYARRVVTEEELANPAYQPGMEGVEAVGAVIALPAWNLEPGEVLKTEMSYYGGPKKYAKLHKLGFHKVRVMEFGVFRPISELLLRALNGVHRWVWPHNYGLAIILLTIVIRIIFWPITHKSTESMKRMQEIQPLAQELREKYKDNPQKQQQELMALYKEHKVNPVGGCLPMLIQIPVFIGLFTVLRSAIELRFAPFLWIHDLSQPENLFADVLPFPFNPLPLVMAGTMFWQQKLTTGGATGGETQQQKMMAFMPLLLLFIFYRMPSGLVLYWTTNQCLMIIQQLVSKKKKAAEAAA
jgi:YidC/Oxa1 family membrane protein insertase